MKNDTSPGDEVRRMLTSPPVSAAFGRLPGSTTTSESVPATDPRCRPLRLCRESMTPPPRVLPNRPRVRGQIDRQLAEAIKRCVTGEAPWPLLIVGNVGTGKTCAALYLCDRTMGSDRYVTRMELADEFGRMRRGELRVYGTHSDKLIGYLEWRRVVELLDLLVIDEIDSRDRVSDNDYDAIKIMLDIRWGLPTIYIANLTLPDIARVYDERIASRLAEGTVVMVNGDDRRIT